MGEWIKRDIDRHRCDNPHLLSDAPQAETGDLWKCDCGVVYQVTGFDSGMQWDPFPTVIRWRTIRTEAPKIPTR